MHGRQKQHWASLEFLIENQARDHHCAEFYVSHQIYFWLFYPRLNQPSRLGDVVFLRKFCDPFLGQFFWKLLGVDGSRNTCEFRNTIKSWCWFGFSWVGLGWDSLRLHRHTPPNADHPISYFPFSFQILMIIVPML